MFFPHGMKDLYNGGGDLTLLDTGMFIPTGTINSEELILARRDPTILNRSHGRDASSQGELFWDVVNSAGDVGVLPHTLGEVEKYYSHISKQRVTRSLCNRNGRNYGRNRRTKTHDRFDKGVECVNEVVEAYSHIRLYARQNVFGLPTDDSFKNLVSWVDELSSHFKPKYRASLRDAENARGTTIYDSELFASALYRCFSGCETTIISRDVDFPRLTQSTSRIASLKWGEHELLRRLGANRDVSVKFLPPEGSSSNEFEVRTLHGFNVFYYKDYMQRHRSLSWEHDSIKTQGPKLAKELSLIVADIHAKNSRN